MQKITPFLWFKNEAEEAVDYYTSIFKNSKKGEVARYGPEGPGPEGSVMVAAFEIEGQKFTALNGGPHDQFNDSISFVVNCDGQEEVDYYWDKLTADGGKPVQCGWLKDKFGVSWQIVPVQFFKLLEEADPARKSRIMKAMMQMVKLDVKVLEEA